MAPAVVARAQGPLASTPELPAALVPLLAPACRLAVPAEEGTAVEKPSPHIDEGGESDASAIPAGAGLLLVVATLLVAGLCAYRHRQKGRHARAVSQLYDDMAAASGETPWFETRVYIILHRFRRLPNVPILLGPTGN